jgi:hypothetical protein
LCGSQVLEKYNERGRPIMSATHRRIKVMWIRRTLLNMCRPLSSLRTEDDYGD